MTLPTLERTLTELDHVRLTRLLQRQATQPTPMGELLDWAHVVPSPVGRALLGLRVGDVARWATTDGGAQSAEIVALLFQPQASGDYTL
jgi:regulator of nucleoside diphosphate kinase